MEGGGPDDDVRAMISREKSFRRRMEGTKTPRGEEENNNNNSSLRKRQQLSRLPSKTFENFSRKTISMRGTMSRDEQSLNPDHFSTRASIATHVGTVDEELLMRQSQQIQIQQQQLMQQQQIIQEALAHVQSIRGSPSTSTSPPVIVTNTEENQQQLKSEEEKKEERFPNVDTIPPFESNKSGAYSIRESQRGNVTNPSRIVEFVNKVNQELKSEEESEEEENNANEETLKLRGSQKDSAPNVVTFDPRTSISRKQMDVKKSIDIRKKLPLAASTSIRFDGAFEKRKEEEENHEIQIDQLDDEAIEMESVRSTEGDSGSDDGSETEGKSTLAADSDTAEQARRRTFLFKFARALYRMVKFITKFKIPVADWYLMPFLISECALILTAVLLRNEVMPAVGPTITTLEWLLWFAGCIFSLFIIHFFVQLVFKFVKTAYAYTRAFYFINSSGYQYSFLLWSIALLVVWRSYFKNRVLDIVNFWVETIIISLMVVCIFRCILVILKKVLISRIQRNEHWENISDLMFKERVLGVLLSAPRKRRLNAQKKDPKPSEFRRGWKYLKQAYATEGREYSSKHQTFSEAVEMANMILMNLDADEDSLLIPDDFLPFFKKASHALRAFEIFDQDKSNTITLDEIIITIYEIFRNRKALFNTMYDRKNAAKILYNITDVIYWIIMVIVVLLIFGVDLKGSFTPIATFTITLSFIFGESAKTCWESVIFLFVIKPFEVGDRITVASGIGGTFPTLIVSRITLFVTYAHAVDGPELVLPNAMLYRSFVKSFKRSKDYAVSVNIGMNQNTSRLQIQLLRTKIMEWLYEDVSVSSISASSFCKI
eukprot:TRINITY_DN4765_c1_g1_i4.p1 TRINITY_DN4765_c1_g1~~TRINITY_DN4765_c1_g1_i4.p1  ORF type:complete len:829 (+),score=279.54 TRINITY_DN4765_c1_g1_i4:313-2799(+)